MSTVPVWFERKFQFGYPVEMMPNLLARLRGTAARLEDATRDVPHNKLIVKPGGKWSAQEQVGHLLQIEPLWLTRVEDFVRGSDGLTPTDLQNRATDEAGFNQQSLTEIIRNFRETRGQLLERIPQIEPEAFSRAIIHPRMKVEMRLMDNLFFVAEHDDHHLAIIWEITH